MIVITTKLFKSARGVDDQPNFYEPRHQEGQGEILSVEEGSEKDEVEKLWKKKKGKRKATKIEGMPKRSI